MYYLLITLATVLFGLMFFFNKKYQQDEGSSLRAAMLFAFFTAIIRSVQMLALNKFRIDFSWFSFAIAFFCAVNSILFTYSSVKALDKTNLSAFSVFSMLGGMMLPFIYGLIFSGESFTVMKLVCCILITLALVLGAQKGESQKGAAKFYAAVFVFNGMSGVLSAIHQSNPVHISSEGYMFLSAVLTAVISGVFLLASAKKGGLKLNQPKRSLLNMTVYALVSGLGNLLLLIALEHLDASVQYPFVTGGTILVSTVISLCMREKLTKKQLLAVVIAFAATIILVF